MRSVLLYSTLKENGGVLWTTLVRPTNTVYINQVHKLGFPQWTNLSSHFGQIWGSPMTNCVFPFCLVGVRLRFLEVSPSLVSCGFSVFLAP